MKTNVTQSLKACLVATAGMLLAGCSATHVGESWQCPLAQGTSCTTIAEADPAVPAGAAQPAVLFGEPLSGARRQVGGEAVAGWRDTDEACDDDCGFVAWFKALFGGDTDSRSPHLVQEAPAPATTEQPAAPEPAADTSFRVPEVLGRIWIAPFVDADGVYREAHWVRVVLEPAGWKLP